MLKSAFIFISAAIICFSLASCKTLNTGIDNSPTNTNPTETPSAAPIDAGSGSETTAQPDVIAESEFSFQVGNVNLILREHDVDTKLASIPLAQVSDTTRNLGNGSDITIGPLLRTVICDGLEIRLVALKGKEDDFLIAQMIATKKGIVTSRGLQVGDSLDKLLKTYPKDDIKPNTGDGDGNIYRFVSIDPYEVIEFTVAEDNISQIAIIYNIP